VKGKRHRFDGMQDLKFASKLSSFKIIDRQKASPENREKQLLPTV
jgi:hypothetical protein